MFSAKPTPRPRRCQARRCDVHHLPPTPSPIPLSSLLPIVAFSDPAGPQSSAACAVVASDLGFGPRCRTCVRQWPDSGSDLAQPIARRHFAAPGPTAPRCPSPFSERRRPVPSAHYPGTLDRTPLLNTPWALLPTLAPLAAPAPCSAPRARPAPPRLLHASPSACARPRPSAPSPRPEQGPRPPSRACDACCARLGPCSSAALTALPCCCRVAAFVMPCLPLTYSVRSAGAHHSPPRRA